MVDVNSIMLVDDDDISNFVTMDVIKESELVKDVFVAMNGKDALELVQEKCIKNSATKPVLVFLDINMPVMDGFEFLEEFEKFDEEEKEDIYIVMLTSSEDDDDVQRAKLHTISGYIPKPLTKEKLQEVMSKLF